ncbi:MAG: chorismate synthase, partial [Muribaculum sp.]|nr:chorismate synthase [Muribaculum sp.]
VTGCPPGLGEPVFDRLQARLSAAMMSINAAKGFEYGDGFKIAERRGSEVVDNFSTDNKGNIITLSNHSGGIQGGISNGMPINMRIAFKPTPTIAREIETVDAFGTSTVLKAKGRHDPCVVPRAVPVVEAMASMVIFDSILENRSSKI